MKLISHRGNLNGPNRTQENKPSYIIESLNAGYDVEIDVWYEDKKWWLGHDKPNFKINYLWIYNKSHSLWIHCKNEKALEKMSKRNGRNILNESINYFWHDKDKYTITSKGIVWCNIGIPLLINSVCVIPEGKYSGNINGCYGICSDYIRNWKYE